MDADEGESTSTSTTIHVGQRTQSGAGVLSTTLLSPGPIMHSAPTRTIFDDQILDYDAHEVHQIHQRYVQPLLRRQRTRHCNFCNGTQNLCRWSHNPNWTICYDCNAVSPTSAAVRLQYCLASDACKRDKRFLIPERLFGTWGLSCVDCKQFYTVDETDGRLTNMALHVSAKKSKKSKKKHHSDQHTSEKNLKKSKKATPAHSSSPRKKGAPATAAVTDSSAMLK